MAKISKYTLQQVAELVFAEEERKELEKKQQETPAENAGDTQPESPERAGDSEAECE